MFTKQQTCHSPLHKMLLFNFMVAGVELLPIAYPRYLCHTYVTHVLVSHLCHTCVTLVTLVSHLCHTCVTLVSHLCHTYITLVSHMSPLVFSFLLI